MKKAKIVVIALVAITMNQYFGVNTPSAYRIISQQLGFTLKEMQRTVIPFGMLI